MDTRKPETAFDEATIKKDAEDVLTKLNTIDAITYADAKERHILSTENKKDHLSFFLYALRNEKKENALFLARFYKTNDKSGSADFNPYALAMLRYIWKLEPKKMQKDLAAIQELFKSGNLQDYNHNIKSFNEFQQAIWEQESKESHDAPQPVKSSSASQLWQPPSSAVKLPGMSDQKKEKQEGKTPQPTRGKQQ